MKHDFQVMTWPDDTYDEYRRSSDFFKRHLSPGLNLPSVQAIREAVGNKLQVTSEFQPAVS
jgi:cyclopropane fatty-acyl-phospholipid synthase-like methyltransferase